MNFVLSVGVLSSVFVSVVYGQYYPHRSPVPQKPLIYSANDNTNDNPFQRAFENQGYYQRFTDYGSQRSKPLTQVKQSHNTYSSDNSKGKGQHNQHNQHNQQNQQNQDNFDDSAEYDFEQNLDYNDMADGKEFDPFKFVSDGVAGIGDYADVGGFGDAGGLADAGHHFDYNTDFNSE